MYLFKLKITSFCCLLFITCSLFAQDNSPWKKFKEETKNGVVIAPGCHSYSLTQGQGFSVYLRNENRYPVNIKGSLVAKTVCGNEVVSPFNITLKPRETASGGDFYHNANGQTGIVTAQNCGGERYNKTSNYINRIREVRVDNAIITLADSSGTILDEPVTKVSSSTSSTISSTKTQVQTSLPKFDSLQYYKSLWAKSSDSLQSEIEFLKQSNTLLSDSLTSLQNKTISKISEPSYNIGNIAPLFIAPKAFSLLYQLGVGLDKLPLMINNDSLTTTNGQKVSSSYSGSSLHPLLQVGLLAKLFNTSLVQLHVNPFATYGINWSSDINAHHITYGLNTQVFANLKKSSALKLVLNAGYLNRNGTYNEGRENADYNYNLLKYGLGLRFPLNKQIWLQPSINIDQQLSGSNTSSTVFGLLAGLCNNWNIGLQYSGKYINPGTVKYAVSNNLDKDFWAVRLLYNGLFKK